MNADSRPRYTIHRAPAPPPMDAAWNDPAWAAAESLEIGHFHPKSSSHHPKTQARMLYGPAHLYGIFHVADRFVRCTHFGYQSAVYKDACVEFFVKPRAEKGHFNFEMNAAGQLLLRYIEDPRRHPDGSFFRQVEIPESLAQQIAIRAPFDSPVDPEIAEPLTWSLAFRIPISLLETYAGPLGSLEGQEWTANFNKCAEENSHPHWATWAPLGEVLNFHQPDKFGIIRFE